MKVLISAVASDIGFGAARILRGWGIFSRLYGVDIHSDHAGLFVLDECAVAPRAIQSDYIEWISDYITTNEIDVFLPCSEAEIFILANAGLKNIAGAKLIINSQFVVDNSLDKYKCLRYLAGSGITVPENGLVGVDNPKKFPVVVKPRSGQGSKGVRIAGDQKELLACQNGWVWQDYLVPDDEEYTCPVYASAYTGIRIVIIKRKLIGGLTGSGMVVDIPVIESYVKNIVKVMNIKGAVNIQIRLTKAGPLLFEINPRLSSTLVFRDKFGFCDLRWWLEDELGLQRQAFNPPKPGTYFYRGSSEYISYV